MPRLALFVAVALVAASFQSVWADTKSAVADLESKLQKACVQHDLPMLKACYELTNVSPYLIDQHLGTWQEYWNETGKTQWAFDKIEYSSIVDLKSDTTLNWASFESMIGPRKMGEHTYAPNLEVVGFVTIHFKDSKGSSVGSTQPVGIAADGTAKIASLHQIP